MDEDIVNIGEDIKKIEEDIEKVKCRPICDVIFDFFKLFGDILKCFSLKKLYKNA